MPTPPETVLVPPELLRLREETPRALLEEEVARLFLEFRSPLLRYLLSIGLRIADGEEIIQEVFFALFLHLKSGKPRDNLRGWIFRVGHNQGLKRRGRLRAAKEPATDHRDPALNPEERATRNQRQSRVTAVLRALPDQDRQCLALRAEGLRYREIAEVLNISLGTVSTVMARSLSKVSRATEGT